MGFVCYQTEHDEIGVLPIDTMAVIGLVVRIVSHHSDVFHDFVLALPWNLVAAENYLEISPQRILFDFLPNKVFDSFGHTRHEFGSRSDTIRIEEIRFLDVTCIISFFWEIFGRLCHILGGTKSTGTLLVELGPRSDSIDSHVNGNSWFDDLGDDPVEIVHNSKHHVTFRYDVRYVHVAGMSTSMNNPIHVEIQVIKLGEQCRIGHDFVDLCVPFTDPSVKLKVVR